AAVHPELVPVADGRAADGVRRELLGRLDRTVDEGREEERREQELAERPPRPSARAAIDDVRDAAEHPDVRREGPELAHVVRVSAEEVRGDERRIDGESEDRGG